MSNSKALTNYDQSGFEFSKELLDGSHTSAINFDRIQKHPVEGYIIFEYLLCEETQKVTPYTSHPSKYWHLNSRKFIALWNVAKDLKATLYLVNYAKKGTKHQDKVCLIKVINMDANGIVREEKTNYTRDEFKEFFVRLNNECL